MFPAPAHNPGSAAELAIDRVHLRDWLISLGLRCTGPVEVTRIGAGNSNLTFLVTDTADRRWVLRRPPLGELLASAHDVVREARVVRALEDTDVPVPRVLGVGAQGEVPMVLLSYVEGQVIEDIAVAETLTPHQRRATSLALARALAQVHAVDLATTGLTDLASHRPYAERQLRRWSRQWEQSRTRELPRVDQLTTRLTAAIPEQHELTLVHGDFHLRNMIIAPTDGSITAVLDWELCTLGDPLADLGSLLAYWCEPGELAVPGFEMTALPGFPSRQELVDEYLDHTGRDPAALAFWHALGLWKLAIIAEGVRRRTLDNPDNSTHAGAPTIAQIDHLVDLADVVATATGL
ncbi:phosphotransferase family protein [Nocardia sp. NPDC058705]|uniref:phosphotransferase family protein n=1 Tax=Nocardia sp. NPDC058705 TaxID=3346609 RepID=UPI00367B85BC